MDRKSFAETLDKHKDAVYGYALHMLGHPEDAEDTTQNVFVSYWERATAIGPGEARPWLMRVCRNACLDLLRRRKVRRWSAAAARVAVEGAWGLAAVRGAADDPSSQELDVTDRGRGAQRIEASASAEEALAAIHALDEPSRSVVLLRELSDLKYEEIASALDMSLGSVKVTLHRARARLRRTLGGEATS